jgi:hypothetical protein
MGKKSCNFWIKALLENKILIEKFKCQRKRDSWSLTALPKHETCFYFTYTDASPICVGVYLREPTRGSEEQTTLDYAG